jgi:hypothetical protein
MAAIWVVVCHVIAVNARHLLHRKTTIKGPRSGMFKKSGSGINIRNTCYFR